MSTVTTPDLRLIEDRLDVLRKLATPGTNASRTLVDHRIHEACDAVQQALRQCGRCNEAAKPVYDASRDLESMAAAAFARSAHDQLDLLEKNPTSGDPDAVRLTIGTLENYLRQGINGVDLEGLRRRYSALLHV